MSAEDKYQISQQPEREVENLALLEVEGEVVEQETVHMDQARQGGVREDWEEVQQEGH